MVRTRHGSVQVADERQEVTLGERTAREREVEVGPDELVVGRRGARAGVRDLLEDCVVVGQTLPRPRVAGTEGEVAGLVLDPEVELLLLERRIQGEVIERVVRGDLEVRRQQRVVLHVLADVREVDDGLDAEGLGLVRGADTREEYL